MSTNEERAAFKRAEVAAIRPAFMGPPEDADHCPMCAHERSAGAAPLDVDVLARALDVLSDDGLEYDSMAPEDREFRFDAAESLAAEYERLSRE